MIEVHEIRDTDFETLIKTFDEKINYLKTQFNIELKTYGNILRIALNNIQSESFNNLIERTNINRELENALSNADGYTTDFIAGNNPKTILSEILNYLQTKQLKFIYFKDFLNKITERETIIADTNDIDFLTQIIRNKRIKIISLAELKRNLNIYKKIIFYSFNGKKDFDFIYNLQIEVSLVLYEQEHQLYKSQLQKRKQLIEEEVRSDDRKNICGISYVPIPDLPIHVSQTIENIVNRIDDWSKRVYENYKEESDILLDELPEKCIFKITYANNKIEYIDSNETIYTANGDLLKIYLSQIKIGDKIRTYPREHFAENLYQVAVETDSEVFGKVEEHSKYWLAVLTELKQTYSNSLYAMLKANGLRVLPATVESYFNGCRKFPMFNSDIKAIFRLKFHTKKDEEIDLLLAPIRKSKSIYNSTMIALGRGIKQEIKLFLKEKIIGEILTKLKFTATTLKIFVDEYMPLQTIKVKEVYKEDNEQIELNNFQQLEL
ncbi:MAG: hypothetical protein WC223_06265 [Bacteroidales bacterium]|jgi:hypothetical protein